MDGDIFGDSSVSSLTNLRVRRFHNKLFTDIFISFLAISRRFFKLIRFILEHSSHRTTTIPRRPELQS